MPRNGAARGLDLAGAHGRDVQEPEDSTPGAERCYLDGLSHLRAPVFCVVHGRYHAPFDLRREKVVAAVEAHGRRRGAR